jgi:hypothetical protein
MDEEQALVLATQVSEMVMAIVGTVWAGLIYETIALRTGKVPTFTRIINGTPRVFRVVFVGGIAILWTVWGVFHFKAL